MKLTTFFISKTKQIYAKILTVLESTFKVKAMLPQILFEILLTSAIICKQRLSHENKIVQYLQDYKYQDINQGHFRKPLQASANNVKNNCPIKTHIFFTGRSILSYFLRLICYNFRTALTKPIKLHFLKIAYSCDNPARSDGV